MTADPDGVSPALISQQGADFHIGFHAMATLCELRAETYDAVLASAVREAAEREARRIEHKFSRYRSDSMVSKINSVGPHGLDVDAETADLLTRAQTWHQTSGGLFDVTSGILRRAWCFDGSETIPDPKTIMALLPFVGWSKVCWDPPHITLAPGMEIDLGGIGKEYAVDQVLREVSALAALPVLVNFGGDVRVSGPRGDGRAWKVAIDGVEGGGKFAGILQLTHGALATSGDARRYVLRDGVRYGHILNPNTGWPVMDAPRSVTVAAPSCMEAGMAATSAILQGVDAEYFLKREGYPAWCVR